MSTRVPEIPLWLRLARFVNRSQDRFRANLQKYGLNLAQFDVIAQVGRREGLTQRELADRLVVTPGNITQLIDRMSAQGLVVRTRDGRCNSIVLTECGRDLYRRAVPDHEQIIAEQFEALTPDERDALSRMARKLLQSATSEDES